MENHRRTDSSVAAQANTNMNYWIARGTQKHGPYSLEDVRGMLGAGSIAPGDLAWKDGMPQWLPVGQVLATQPAAAGGAPPPYGYAPPQQVAQPVYYPPPIPSDLHWGLVLLFSILTFGIFGIVWIFIEASYVKRIDPRSNAIVLLVVSFLVPFAGLICFFIAIFSMRNSLATYYNYTEPINLRLSGVMTFFFSTLYFQHHLTRIAQWKRTGILTPQ